MDPTQPPAPADPAAPSVQPAAAPAPAPPAAPAPRVLNYHAQPRTAPAAPAAQTAAPAAPVEPPPSDPRIDGLMAALRESVSEQLAAVPEGVRKTVADLAGDDPIAQRAVLARLRANGLVSPPAPAPAPIPAGATTGAQIGPLPTAAAALDVDPDVQAFRQWQSLRDNGAATTAAALYTTNAPAIQRGRAKASASN